MKDRTADILEAAVREFIDSGEPVSSACLYERYNFGIRPAMIRFELNELAETGFLEQPHHSAGRVPTDQGFEFFARRSVERAQERSPESSTSALAQLFTEHAWRELLGDLSRKLGILGVVQDAESGAIYKDGLENLVNHLEWETRQELMRVIHDFEEIDDRLGVTRSRTAPDEDFLDIFIGKKSPVTRSEQLAVMSGEYSFPDGRVSLFIIGPKRMDYRKIATILYGLKRLADVDTTT